MIDDDETLICPECGREVSIDDVFVFETDDFTDDDEPRSLFNAIVREYPCGHSDVMGESERESDQDRAAWIEDERQTWAMTDDDEQNAALNYWFGSGTEA